MTPEQQETLALLVAEIRSAVEAAPPTWRDDLAYARRLADAVRAGMALEVVAQLGVEALRLLGQRLTVAVQLHKLQAPLGDASSPNPTRH